MSMCGILWLLPMARSSDAQEIIGLLTGSPICINLEIHALSCEMMEVP